MMNKIIRILVGTILIISFTQISWDMSLHDLKIPITGQTLAVLLVGYLLSIKEALMSVVLYILLGALGLPVFADGASGLEVLQGNSGGFIIGFFFGAWCIGIWSRHTSNSWKNAFIGMFIGTIVIIIFGVLRLTYSFGFTKALEYGLYPFWMGAIVKIILGGVIGKLLKDRIPTFH